MKQRFIKVKVDNISLYKYNFIVLLRREDDSRILPICIGPAEAHSIAAVINNKPFKRPLTHDLMKDVLDKLDCTIDRVHITDTENGTFFARIYLTTWDGRTLDLDSRPSDAIALALRYDAPIYVREDILNENSVDLEESAADIQEGASVFAAQKEANPAESEEPKDPVSRLKKQMEEAVREERYEDAARCRDELHRLQGN